MKKIFFTIMAIAISAFTLLSCEDVPSPYDIPGFSGGDDDPTSTVTPSGNGTLEDPYNVAGVLEYIKTLDKNVESENEVYIKGKVKTISTDEATIKQYGNHTFTMVDEGSELVFTAYQVYGPGKKKFTSMDQLKEGDEVIVCGKVVNYMGNTPETVGKGASYVYSINGEGGTDVGKPGTPEGAGTKAEPFNVAGAIAFIKTLGSDVESESEVYIKGKVSANNTTDETIKQYGNMTFTMIDEGCEGEFTAFQVYGPGKKKFTSASDIKEGDEVIVCGKVVNYKGNTPETVGKGAAYVYSINGKAEEGGGNDNPQTGDAKGTGTASDPFNVAGIIKYTSALAADKNSDKEVYFTGTVDSFKSGEEPGNSYGNATFYIKDESTSDKFYCFRVMGPNNEKFTSADQLKVGQKVTVCGIVVNYKGNTPETASGKAYIVKVEGEGTGGGNTGGGDVVEPTGDNYIGNGDFESWSGSTPTNWKSASTASSATLEQSKDAHGGSFSCIVKGDANSNKRLAYKEITLDAGTYTFSFYAKGTADPAQVRPGIVPVTDGKVGSYAYGDYATLSNSWTLVSHTFTLDAKATICLVIMNPKKSSYSAGADVLIDDAKLTKASSAKGKSTKRRK